MAATGNSVPILNLRELEEELIRIKARQGEIKLQIGLLQQEHEDLEKAAGKVVLPLAKERDRLDSLIKGQTAPLTSEETFSAESIDRLELTVRTANLLRMENIQTIGDLLKLTEDDLLKIANLGRKSLNEIREVLLAKGLTVGKLAKKTK
ncbi:MAG: hypothetical protein KBC50_02895 [Candidatus Pacebacteria bacterium]|nr:hypothetical protein [Candidatus Paceibacterota bacterium]